MNVMPTLRFGSLAAVVFAALLTFGSATAQEQPSDAHLEAARTAIDAIGATRQFDAILINAALGLKTQLIQDNPDQESVISATVDEAALGLAGRRADLENEAARVYANLFSQEELDAIAAFYNTEAGQKLIQNGPVATRQVLQAADIWSRGVSRDLAEAVGAQLRERIGGNATATAPDGTPQAPAAQ